MQELGKILEEIEEGTHTFKLFGRDVDFVAIDWVRDIIRKHMNDGWIPVEERMPEGQTRVICQFDNGDIELLWQDWESDPETLTYLADFSMMAEKKVIAWRPLPDPYRPRKEQKMTYQKILTPKFREEINNSISIQEAELNDCQNTPYVSAQKVSLQVLRNLINALPDGFPIPVEGSNHDGK